MRAVARGNSPLAYRQSVPKLEGRPLDSKQISSKRPFLAGRAVTSRQKWTGHQLRRARPAKANRVKSEQPILGQQLFTGFTGFINQAKQMLTSAYPVNPEENPVNPVSLLVVLI